MNEAEAETVRHIFDRFLQLGCVRLLAEDLKRTGVRSKRRAYESGKAFGGKPMDRDMLYRLLTNRAYVGETVHKGRAFKGEHKAILPKDVFAAVQEKVAESPRRVMPRVRAAQDAPFAGLLFDDTGEEMVPNYVVKANGARYRYYVSRSTLKGAKSKAAITRIPAPAFEGFLEGVLSRMGLPLLRRELRTIVRRIEVQLNSIEVRLDAAAAIEHWRAASAELARESDAGIVADRRTLLGSGDEILSSIFQNPRSAGEIGAPRSLNSSCLATNRDLHKIGDVEVSSKSAETAEIGLANVS